LEGNLIRDGEEPASVKILVTDPIATPGLKRLRAAGHTVVEAYDASPAELQVRAADAAALIVRSATRVDTALLENAPPLHVVTRAGVGVDNIDVEAATRGGVIVANAPTGNVEAAGEHAVAMALAAARSIPQAHNRLKGGEWAKDDFLGTELAGKTVGIVGLGRVGSAAAERYSGMGMELVAHDPYIEPARAAEVGAELVELPPCLERADVLSVHAVLTDETEGLIGAAELTRLGGGYVVNCARGGIVDETALATAVAEGPLDGAAIDVFGAEPVEPDNPLLAVDEIVVTPHIGAATARAQQRVATTAAEQVIAALAGDPVPNALNDPS
jgi:D-3-phosphoglycerate dehydrogenase